MVQYEEQMITDLHQVTPAVRAPDDGVRDARCAPVAATGAIRMCVRRPRARRCRPI